MEGVGAETRCRGSLPSLVLSRGRDGVSGAESEGTTQCLRRCLAAFGRQGMISNPIGIEGDRLSAFSG
jgi:hypothetical protein